MRVVLALAAILLSLGLGAANAQIGLPWPGPGGVASGGGGGGGTHTLVAHGIVSGITGGTTGALNTTGSTLIVLTLQCFTNSGANHCTPSDSSTNTWTEASTGWDNGSYEIRIYYKYSPTVTSSQTFTVSCVGGGNCFTVMEVQAWSGTFVGSLDQTNFTSSSNTPGSITPTANNELIVTTTVDDGTTNTLSIGSGFTISDQAAPVGGSHVGGGGAYLDQTTAAAVNPAWAVTGVTPNVTGIASFK